MCTPLRVITLCTKLQPTSFRLIRTDRQIRNKHGGVLGAIRQCRQSIGTNIVFRTTARSITQPTPYPPTNTRTNAHAASTYIGKCIGAYRGVTVERVQTTRRHSALRCRHATSRVTRRVPRFRHVVARFRQVVARFRHVVPRFRHVVQYSVKLCYTRLD